MVRAGGIMESVAVGNWMRADKATHTKEGAACSQPVGGREANECVQTQLGTYTHLYSDFFYTQTYNGLFFELFMILVVS